jgi:hypothetical protein
MLSSSLSAYSRQLLAAEHVEEATRPDPALERHEQRAGPGDAPREARAIARRVRAHDVERALGVARRDEGNEEVILTPRR